jgi:hypothetical protein
MLRILADCYEEKGENDKAVSQLKTAVKIIESFSGDTDVEFFTGTVYEKRKHEIPGINERISLLIKQ